MSYKEIQRRKNLTSRVLQLQVDRFVSNKNNKIIMPARPNRSSVNKNGFIEVLNGAIESHDYETLECIIPKDVDLSIRQNGGFSVFFWLYSRKVKDLDEKKFPPDRVFYIFKKGGTVDQFTPSVGLIVELINSQNPGTNNQNAVGKERKVSLIIELSTSKSKKEVLFANKIIEDDHLYSIGISFSINYDEDSTEVYIYIDGKLDTQSSIPGEPIHNQGSVFFGKPDSSSHGFKGTVADLMMIPSPINEREVSLAHSEGLKKLYDTNGQSLGMNGVFGEIFKRKKLINKYALYTKKSIYEIENLGLSNSKMLEIVKNYDKEERENDIRPPPEIIDRKKEKMIKEITNFVSDIDNRILCNKIDMNGCLINTCFYLANGGEDMLEIERVLKIFATLKEVLLFDVEKPFLIHLAKILYAYYVDKENNNVEYLKARTFFINLRLALDTFEYNEEEYEKEQAKFMKKKKVKYKILDDGTRKKLPPSPPRKNIYAILRRSNQEKIEPLPIEETKGFGNCIPEHERLMLKTQNIKNSIDIEQEENLPQYHTTFIIKTLYEKPKNLPGEDPEYPNVKIISTNNDTNEEEYSSEEEEDGQEIITENNENNLDEKKPTQENINNENREPEELDDQNDIKKLLDEIMNGDEFEIKYPELGSVLNDELAQKYQEQIIEAKKAEERKKEELENKKLSENENKNIKGDDKKKEPTEKISYSFDPQFPEGWNNGNFELVINHCYDCDQHTKTTKHYEYTFMDKFNAIGDEVKAKFPNCRVYGNVDEREYLGNFDVYLRYTGLPSDYKGRFLIYSKKEEKKFPSVTDILDKLICLSMMFGSSQDIEKAQSEDIKEDFPKSKHFHEHPGELSAKAEKIKQSVLTKKPEEKIDQERTLFYCLNNGCNKEFVEKNNKPKSCKYHPGVYQFGSYNGYWPECWSCCEGKWDSPGCATGKHRGVLLEKRLMLCLNHGEQTEAGPPDSACGTWYTNRSIDGCKFHSGHIEKGVFTCCQGGPDSEGCQQGQHRTAKYPDPEAKLYFYPKILNNPGVKLEKGQKGPTIADQIKACGYFKQVVDYPDVKAIYKANQDRTEAEKDMERRCLNVGCKKKYKESGNTDKSCLCHPGRWDFGGNGSGANMTDIFTKYHTPVDDKIILENIWKPHWTCCGRDWNSKPCTKCRHHGPLIQDLGKYDLRFRYPDVRYKLNFKRIVGDKWVDYLERNVLSKEKMKEYIMAMPTSFRYNDLPGLCDKLKMNLLILQEDPSFALKYWDIIEKANSISYFCKDDNVDRDKFLKYWETDYMTIYNELHPVKKPEKKEKKEEEKNNA